MEGDAYQTHSKLRHSTRISRTLMNFPITFPTPDPLNSTEYVYVPLPTAVSRTETMKDRETFVPLLVNAPEVKVPMDVESRFARS